MVVSSTSALTTRSSIGCSSRAWASASCSHSTRAACHADQWPDTSAHSDSAATYVTELIQPVMSDTGIIRTQKIVSHPLTRLMNTGSPWMDDQTDLIVPIRRHDSPP